MDKLALRPAEVADAIGLSRSRIYQLIAAGDLPSICIGGMRRVTVDQLREWIARKQALNVIDRREVSTSNFDVPPAA